MKFRKISRNISWPVGMNMQMSELMMSSPHNFPFILCTEMTKMSYFSYENVRLASTTPSLIEVPNRKCLLQWSIRDILGSYYHGEASKYCIFHNFMYEIYPELVMRWPHQLSLIGRSMNRLGQELSCEHAVFEDFKVSRRVLVFQNRLFQSGFHWSRNTKLNSFVWELTLTCSKNFKD